MPENWKKYKLGDLVTYVNGGAWPATCYDNKGIPIVRVSDISKGRVNIDECKYLDIKFKNKYIKHKLEVNDLIVCTVGSHPDKQSSVVGGVAIVPLEIAGAYLNQNAVLLRNSDSKIINQNWLGHLGKSYIFKNHIESEARGSANQVRIAISNLLNLEFSLPPLPEQTAIASILSALDDKIELNLKMNKTLEEMAMTLYKHWFVDFGPFQNGKFIDSELGMIPEGWEVKNIGEVIKIIGGFAFKSKDFSAVGEKVIKIKNISNNVVSVQGCDSIPVTVAEKTNAKFSIKPGAYLVAMTGAEVGKVGIVPDYQERLWLNQRVGMIDEPKFKFADILIGNYLQSQECYEIIQNLAYGSAQPNISSSGLEGISICLPKDISIIKSFLENLKSWDDLKVDNYTENQTLTTLRDTLLPKLISGEVRVKDIENQVAAIL